LGTFDIIKKGGEVVDTPHLEGFEAPELSLSEIQEIKVPVDLFDMLPLGLCKKYQVLPLRFDQSTQTLSLIYADPDGLEDLKSQSHSGWTQLSAYRVNSEDLHRLISELERMDAAQTPLPEGNWTVALIEKDPEIRNALQSILLSQSYAVTCFDSEQDFRAKIQELSRQITNEEDLVNLAENHRLVPFQSVLVRKTSLETSSTFCDFVWAHFNHIRVAVLEDRWLQGVMEQALLRGQSDADDFAFHLRHGDYYHAALECLKKGSIFQAVELLEQVSPEDAHFIKAKLLLGKAFLQKKNFNKACLHFQNAYDHWCEDPEAVVDESVIKLLYYLAYSFEKLGRLDDALKLYERVAAENPLFREVNQRIANVKDRRKKAIKDGERKMGMPAFSKKDREDHRYEKVEEIGKGGMGIVYLARDRVLGREVALKVLNSHFKHDEKIVETFLREAKSLASLNHLNIVTIFDAGIEDGNYYISMEFIDGKTVRELLKKKGHFKLSTSIALSKQVLKALAYAHSKKVIHRDITTNNMMLTETKVVKLMDFGLARVVNQLHSEQSIIGGTPYFMSPEQVEGAPIDHRTDIYSFGVCLFEMLTGQVPFPMENPGYHHLHSNPPDPRSLKSNLPIEVSKLILKCLEKRPENRFQSADELLNRLRDLPGDD
jgi:tetratricopeptide (TPR) repeat protein